MKVLICGAGIAGLTLAYWLHEAGIEAVVIERAPDLRTEGYMIDFAGTGCDVAEWMGLDAQLAAYDAGMNQVIYHNAAGGVAARLNTRDLYAAAHVTGKFYALDRCDLVRAIYSLVEGHCEVRFGLSPRALAQDENGVDVTFSDGNHARFDLVIGADGFHSQTRRLIFGDEAQFAHDLGYHFAICFMERLNANLAHGAHLYVEPGLQVGVFPADATRWMIFVTYRSDAPVPQQDRHLVLQRLLNETGWIAPQIAAHLTPEMHIFMDSVTQIIMPHWSQGRVALVGDAAYCPTLVSGQGASMAMAGGYLLAQALQSEPDYTAAFAQYERWLRPDITHIQEKAQKFAPTFVPRSQWRIFLTHWSIRLINHPWVARFVGKQFSIDSIFDNDALPHFLT